MARQPAGSPVLEALLDQYEYDGIQTCAADGTCALACPLGIDTGTLMKAFRAQERTPRDQRAGLAFAKRWAKRGARSRAPGLHARPLSKALSAAGRAVLSDELVPAWPDEMPPPAPSSLPKTRREGAAAIYLPACINRIFGPSLPEALVRVSERAGRSALDPGRRGRALLRRPVELEGPRRGRRLDGRSTPPKPSSAGSGADGLPVVTDASSCTHGLHGILEDVEVLDSIEWVHDRVLPKLEPDPEGRARSRSILRARRAILTWCRSCGGWPRRWRKRSWCPPPRRAAEWRATGASCTPNCPVLPPGRRPPRSIRTASMPTSRVTERVRSV